MRWFVDPRRFVLALAGWLVVATLAWAALSRVYNRVLAAAASLLGSAAPPGISFTASGNDVLARLHPLSLGEAGQTAFSGMQFHYNLVILIALILASS